MKEKLLAALKSKFAGVQEAILDRIATNKAGSVTDENQVQSIVDGVTVQDIINSESDYRASQESKSASKKAISDYEKKHKLKDGKVIEDPEAQPDSSTSKKKDGDGEDEKVPAWAQKLIKDNEDLRKEVADSKKDRETSDKRQQAKELLKASKIPETMKVKDETVKLHEKWLRRIVLDDEETSIEDQVKDLEAEYLAFEQNRINSSEESDDGAGGGGEGVGAIDDYLDNKFGGAEESSQTKN